MTGETLDCGTQNASTEDITKNDDKRKKDEKCE